jgi:hypothetical protein
MKKETSPIRLYIFLIFSILNFSCEKYENLTEQVEFYEPNYFGICFSGLFDKNYDEVIITDNDSYQEFGNSIRIHPFNLDCDTAVLPYIDFDKYSLIGKYTEGGGCDVNYERQIIDDKKHNKIVYTINIEYFGNCAMLIFNMNWALIPKLKKNYTVEFKVEEL